MNRYNFYKPNQPDSDLGYFDQDEDGDWVQYDEAEYEMLLLKKQNSELLKALKDLLYEYDPDTTSDAGTVIRAEERAEKLIQKAEENERTKKT